MVANAAVADVLTEEPLRRAWHRARPSVSSDDDVVHELEATYGVALQRGARMIAEARSVIVVRMVCATINQLFHRRVAAEFGAGSVELR
jgi:hypothetical protein